MKTQIEKKDDFQIEITSEMPWEEFDYYRVQAIEKESKNVKIDGFRPGKVPKEMVEEKMGQDYILTKAADLVLKDKYWKILEDQQIEPILSPSVEILKLAQNNPFCFKIKAFIFPEVHLPDLREIVKAVKKIIEPCKAKEVDDALNWILKSRADFKNLERGALLNDFVEIEYGSAQIENNKIFQDKFILGQGKLVEGFENNLLEMRPGQKKSFSCDFPSDFANQALAGKKVDFEVKMLAVKEMILPDLNDDFAKQLGDFKDLSDLKDKVKQGIFKEKEIAAKMKWRVDVLTAIIQKINLKIPPIVLEQELARANQEKELKVSIEKKEKLEKITEERILKGVCLNQIIKQEKIVVLDEEVEEEVNKFLTNYPQEKTKEIDLDKLKGYYKERIIEEKIFNFLDGLLN
ncbi:trigger factor [Candidatus Gribaldobacteria bacterium]|nr:trigger factor [Candidatus Gribaldobacteria bacterium]